MITNHWSYFQGSMWESPCSRHSLHREKVWSEGLEFELKIIVVVISRTLNKSRKSFP